jgi:hypothetical protein
MNLNQLAKEITKREGLKKQVNIAQVKEILRVIVDMQFACIHDRFFDALTMSPARIIINAAVDRMPNFKPKKKKTKKAKRK